MPQKIVRCLFSSPIDVSSLQRFCSYWNARSDFCQLGLLQTMLATMRTVPPHDLVSVPQFLGVNFSSRPWPSRDSSSSTHRAPSGP